MIVYCLRLILIGAIKVAARRCVARRQGPAAENVGDGGNLMITRVNVIVRYYVATSIEDVFVGVDSLLTSS